MYLSFQIVKVKLEKKIDKFLKKEIEIKSKYDIIDMFAKDRNDAINNILTDLHNGDVVLSDSTNIN